MKGDKWTIGEFASVVEIGRARYQGSVISGGRSIKRNKAVGGHEDSFHLVALANDIVFDTVRGARGATKFYRRQGLHVKQNGDSGKTIHVQPPLAPSLKADDIGPK